MMTETIRERMSLGQMIHSASHNGVSNTGTLDMSLFNRANFIIDVGTLGASGTIDASLYESDNANAAAPNGLIAGSAITQIIAANKTATVEVRADQMTRRYLLLSSNNNVAASVYSVFPCGHEPRNHPCNSNDYADVSQRLVV